MAGTFSARRDKVSEGEKLVKGLTVDSSVIVATLLQDEKRHQEAVEIWEKILAGKKYAVMPYSVKVEVVAAVRRRTGSEALALEIKQELSSLENVAFVNLDEDSTEKACILAAKTGLRGMDAIVVQVALEYGTELVSFDKEMVSKVSKLAPE